MSASLWPPGGDKLRATPVETLLSTTGTRRLGRSRATAFWATRWKQLRDRTGATNKNGVIGRTLTEDERYDLIENI